VKNKIDLLLTDIDNSVGLLLNLEYNGKCFLTLNVHFVFPQNLFDRR